MLTYRLDFSWLPASALLLWWTATVTLPAGAPDTAAPILWLMALVLVLAYLVSVVLHEVIHLLTASRYGAAGQATALFPFGGVRSRESGRMTPETDFLVALAGPVGSATFAFLLLVFAEGAQPGSPVRALLSHLAALNALLAALNLVPAFPLDAGRALRAALWAIRGDFAWATTTSSRFGSIAGTSAIVLGIFVILGDAAPRFGLALLLLGFMVRSAASQSHRHLLTRSSLEGIPVRRFMDENPVTVQRALSIKVLAEDFIYKHQLNMLPVVDGERLLGYVTAQRLRELPREEWSRQSIGTIVLPLSSDDTVSPEADALEALDKMTRKGLGRLMVVEEGRLAGVVAMQDLAREFEASQPTRADAS